MDLPLTIETIVIKAADEPPAKPLEFFCHTRSGPDHEEFAALVEKLKADDDCRRYAEAYNGETWEPADSRGYTVLAVLPELTGLPFDNLALAYLHAVRPSAVRVSTGCVCLDAWPWRVTVYLDPTTKLIEKVEQEVEVGYGTGHDVATILRARKAGTEPKAPGNVFGNFAGLDRVEFQ